LTWLIPTQASPKDLFDPATYIVGEWWLNLRHLKKIWLFFSPISWYPLGSNQIHTAGPPVRSQEPCVLRNTTQPSRTASW
jgi:hypothetical protein